MSDRTERRIDELTRTVESQRVEIADIRAKLAFYKSCNDIIFERITAMTAIIITPGVRDLIYEGMEQFLRENEREPATTGELVISMKAPETIPLPTIEAQRVEIAELRADLAALAEEVRTVKASIPEFRQTEPIWSPPDLPKLREAVARKWGMAEQKDGDK